MSDGGRDVDETGVGRRVDGEVVHGDDGSRFRVAGGSGGRDARERQNTQPHKAT